MKIILILLIFVIINNGFKLSAQEVKFPLDSIGGQIHYCKVYRSIYSEKEFAIKNWISKEFHCEVAGIKFNDNIVRMLSSIPYYTGKDKKSYKGNIQYLLQIWCKPDRIQLSISDLLFIKPKTNDSLPIENIVHDKNFKKDEYYGSLLDFTYKNIDTLLISFEGYIRSFLDVSPDYIILKEGKDTIRYKIVEDKIIYLKYQKLNSPDTNTYTISHDVIDYYIKNPEVTLSTYEEFPEYDVPQEKVSNGQDNGSVSQTLFINRIAFDFGLSHRTAKQSSKVDRSLTHYIDGLRKGIGFAGNINFFQGNYGFGVHYFFTESSNSIDNLALYQGNTLVAYGRLAEKIHVTFIAPSFCSRHLFFNDKLALHSSVLVGYIGYSDDLTFINETYFISGSTLGCGGLLGIEYVFNNSTALGFSISYITGTLNEVEVNGNQQISFNIDEQESLNRVEFNIGVRFYFRK